MCASRAPPRLPRLPVVQADDELVEGVKPAWLEVERVIAERTVGSGGGGAAAAAAGAGAGDAHEGGGGDAAVPPRLQYGQHKQYLCKWRELPYSECTWEEESDISEYRHLIQQYRWGSPRYRSAAGNRGSRCSRASPPCAASLPTAAAAASGRAFACPCFRQRVPIGEIQLQLPSPPAGAPQQQAQQQGEAAAQTGAEAEAAAGWWDGAGPDGGSQGGSQARRFAATPAFLLGQLHPYQV